MTESARRILLVEDDVLTALAQRRTLESGGYAVTTAHTGHQALETVSDSFTPDLILMDIDLGRGMDGTETAQRILEHHSLPVVFLSSHAEPDVIARTEKIASYGYIHKSVPDAILLTSVRVALRLWDAHRKVVESDSLQADLSEQVPGAFYQYQYFPDGRSRFPMASPNIWHVCEVTPEDIADDAGPMFQRIHSDDFDTVVASIIRSRDTLEEWEHEFRVLLPSKGERWLRARAKPKPLTDGSVFWHGYISDITNYKTSEAKSPVQHEILEAIRDAIIVTDDVGTITYHNRAASELYQFAHDSAVGARVGTVIPCRADEDVGCDPSVLRSIADHRQWTDELVIEPPDGMRFTASVSHYPLVDAHGSLHAIVWVSRRLHYGSRVHRTSADTHYLEDELYALVQSNPEIFTFLREGSLDGMWYWDIEKPDNEWMDNRFWEVLGYDPATKRHDPAEWQNLIHPQDLQVALKNFKEHLADPNHPYDQVVRFTHHGGGTVHVRCRGLAIRDEDGKPLRMLGVHNDITELMTKINTEKMLRHELNHRVKNNLTIVASLIALRQYDDAGSADLSSILHQVDAIRVLHEQLQASDELTALDLKPYLCSILSSVFDSSVQVEISGLDVAVSSKTAVPLGLVVNELATNAVKHGFSGHDERRFTVNIGEIGDASGRTRITVSNTGRPFPADVDVNNTASLGLRLVTSLIEQLESRLVLTREPHPTFEFDVEYQVSCEQECGA